MRKMVVMLFLVVLLPALVSAATIGRVTKVKGHVALRTSGAPYRSVSAGEEVEEGSWLKTGRDGWVELTLSDNSRFTVANNSELQAARFLIGKEKREGAFNLVQGKLRASVVKLAGKQTDIRVKSGTAVAGIKGTEFLMLTRGQANVFFGNEGTVSVTGKGDDAEALPAGTMTQNTRGWRPAAAVAVEPGTPLAKAKADFDASTGELPPEEWVQADDLPNIIARWDLNHGHYLADSGRHEEALQIFQIALDLTTEAQIRCDARLERGAVFGRFLNHPEAALGEYLLILEEYPNLAQKETALYLVGQTHYQMGQYELAQSRFGQYLKEFPAGRYRASVDTMLRLLERQDR